MGPYRTDATASRWPIATIPSSRYCLDQNGVNLTLQEATRVITSSFNVLTNQRIKIRDFKSRGGSVVARLRFFVMAIRADWKAHKQLMNLTRHMNTNE
ncbi:Uncharacterized protein SCF082_LOCUS15228, partial [Durusdinium trenchii]